jgi:Transposase IS66 family
MAGERTTKPTLAIQSPGGTCSLRLRMGCERESPKRFLGNFKGILQSDGYGAYDHVGGTGIVHAACWAHAKRKFFDALKINSRGQSSIGICENSPDLTDTGTQMKRENPTVLRPKKTGHCWNKSNLQLMRRPRAPWARLATTPLRFGRG